MKEGKSKDERGKMRDEGGKEQEMNAARELGIMKDEEGGRSNK